LSARISTAIASRSASRTVMVLVGPQSLSAAGAFAWAGTGAAAGAAFGASATGAEAGAGLAVPAEPPFSSAIGVFTATASVPSGTRIAVSVPSSTASTSIVALSVSISAITSPALMVSPCFFSQRASLPSVIVGDSAGIRICVIAQRASIRMSV
jgi:hypothetical protein